jgi:LPS export ABC transporter protein LptC
MSNSMRWRQGARLGLVLVVLAVAVAVAVALKRRAAPQSSPALVRTDPKAIVESTGGRAVRFNRAHEDIRLEYERQLTYKDGSTKLLGVKVSADNRGDGRRFFVTGDEGQVGKDESVVVLGGHVTLVEGDGFTAETDKATYDNRDATVRAPGPVTFHHNRLSGSGIGMLYEKNTDVLTILQKSELHVAPDEAGNGAAEVTSGTAVFGRLERLVRFTQGVRVTRGGQTITAGHAGAHLSMDEKRIEALELHERVEIDGSSATAGGLQSIRGHDVTLKYAADSEALERAIIEGEARIDLAGGGARGGRQISATSLDVTLAPDGQTPVELTARDGVQLTLPSDSEDAARTVKASALIARGDPEDPARGLTQASFTGNVEYREKNAGVDREAHSARLDVGLKAGMSAFENASFTGHASFTDQRITGTAASVRYAVDGGTLALSGSEPGSLRPHVFNDQITVDAASVDVTLAGPVLKAKGDVKSVLQPPEKSSKSSKSPADTATKLPSMLKQDQPVNVTANELTYDGPASKATYDGNAQLWQGDTSIKGNSIGIDDKTGDLTAEGSVVTTTMVEQTDKDKKKERVRSTATAGAFTYEDGRRRAAYRGGVHLTGSQGDLTADSIDLYLRSSGNELDRAEASSAGSGVILREQGRKTTGSHMNYTSADDRYEISGSPVSLTDQCGRVTNGRTLTFRKATDTIEVDGNQRVRTQTKNGKCQ